MIATTITMLYIVFVHLIYIHGHRMDTLNVSKRPSHTYIKGVNARFHNKAMPS